MTELNGQIIGDQVLVSKRELERLVLLARQVEEVKVNLSDDDLPAVGLALLAARGGAFDWLADEPDLYSVDDLKVRYR
jgi:hypothetical protein